MGKTMKRFSRGVTLIELLIGITILVILAGIASANIGRLLQRTKVQAVKSTMGGIGLALDMVKTDTGLYPAIVDDIKEALAPSGFSPRNWRGPYAENISLTDPWGNSYAYALDLGYEPVATTFFGPETFAEGKKGQMLTFNFDASASEGTLTVNVEGIKGGWIKLNGKKVIKKKDFKKGGTITKLVVLLPANKLIVSLVKKKKNPGQMTLSITGVDPYGQQAEQTADTTYTLKSYGKDGDPGGTGYNADIVYAQY